MMNYHFLLFILSNFVESKLKNEISNFTYF